MLLFGKVGLLDLKNYREASRRAEPEPASGRASKLWLPTARVVDIGYCGYGEPLGSAGEGHTGFRRDLARPWSPYGDQGGKRVNG